MEATYEPGGRPDPSAGQEPLEAILVYPLPPNAHATTRAVVSSPDGQAWRVSEGTDSPAIQQVEGPVETLGYVAAAGTAAGARSRHRRPPTESNSNSTLGSC